MELTGDIGTFIISEKDIWEGVEFVECITDRSSNFKKGKIYRRVDEVDFNEPYSVWSEDSVYEDYRKCSTYGIGGNKKHFKPSNESAYVEQLKVEALSKDVLVIGSLDISMMHGGELEDKSTVFKYRKDTDTLYWFGCPIYQSGKWAKKLPERVEVEGISNRGCNTSDDKLDWNYSFDFNLKGYDTNNHGAEKMHCEVLPFLASQLEKYLNGEIGKEDPNG